MKNVIVLIVVALVLCSSCATTDYLMREENSRALIDIGVTCLEDAKVTVKVGALYVYDRTNDMKGKHLGEFVIGCGDGKLFSVICDVTRPPEAGPCSNIRTYLLSSGDAMPKAWLAAE